MLLAIDRQSFLRKSVHQVAFATSVLRIDLDNNLSPRPARLKNLISTQDVVEVPHTVHLDRQACIHNHLEELLLLCLCSIHHVDCFPLSSCAAKQLRPRPDGVQSQLQDSEHDAWKSECLQLDNGRDVRIFRLEKACAGDKQLLNADTVEYAVELCPRESLGDLGCDALVTASVVDDLVRSTENGQRDHPVCLRQIRAPHLVSS